MVDRMRCIPLAKSKPPDEGIIAHDSQGLIMAACTYPHSRVADAFTAKAMACERAVIFAIDLGFRSIHVEGDSLTIIKKLTSATLDKSTIIPIIRDILLLRGSLEAITFSFVGKKRNKAAHELAKLGLQYSEPMYWIESVGVCRTASITRTPPDFPQISIDMYFVVSGFAFFFGFISLLMKFQFCS
ncbi:hypothetical protein V6N11_043223 [Hibiscus sabdariffa]|uniref:RNase H type-1 domain-containing protein n=1 Tax=Hibiscus sabdariffa TaxID=183260 RepID=A0ABR2QYH9_9ROSI